MSLAPRWIRLLMVGSAATFLAVGLAIRAVTDGAIGQYSGAALSGAIVYAIAVFVRPSISPLPAGVAATAGSWAVEFFQLTGIPAALSERSWLAQLVLGARFDVIDVLWYPVGVIPLVGVHWFFRARARDRARRAACASG